MLNIHIYPSTFEYEARLDRIASYLQFNDTFEHVYFIGVNKKGLSSKQPLNSMVTIDRISIPLKKNTQNLIYRMLRFWLWSILIIFNYGNRPIKCINAHSLSTLPVSWLMSKLTNANLVYEPHELETETHSITGLRRILARFVESRFIRSCDCYIFVSQEIENWYKENYNLKNTYVIKNVSEKLEKNLASSNYLRNKFSISNSDMVFLHQGQLGKGRGIELMLTAFSKVNTNLHLVILGFGELEEEIQRHCKTFQNIHYHEPVKKDQLHAITASADVGIHLIENTCLNHFYCLPNKIFEYFNAGIPCIVSNFPELAKLINKFSCGWLFDNSCEDFNQIVENITKTDILSAKENIKPLLNEYCWENEEKKLNLIYGKLLNTKSRDE